MLFVSISQEIYFSIHALPRESCQMLNEVIMMSKKCVNTTLKLLAIGTMKTCFRRCHVCQWLASIVMHTQQSFSYSLLAWDKCKAIAMEMKLRDPCLHRSLRKNKVEWIHRCPSMQSTICIQCSVSSVEVSSVRPRSNQERLVQELKNS
jgi:hypothetical protein